MDLVCIEGLEVRTVIGANDWEREIRQMVRLDLEMAWNVSAAGQTDKLQNALDYFAVSQRLINVIESSSFTLIEALVERCAEVVLDEFSVPWVKIKIAKPLKYLGMDHASIIIERGKK